jgi:hypothetical protein
MIGPIQVFGYFTVKSHSKNTGDIENLPDGSEWSRKKCHRILRNGHGFSEYIHMG